MFRLRAMGYAASVVTALSLATAASAESIATPPPSASTLPAAPFSAALAEETFAFHHVRQLRQLERDLKRAGRPPYVFAQLRGALGLLGAGATLCTAALFVVTDPTSSGRDECIASIMVGTGLPVMALGGAYGVTLLAFKAAGGRRPAVREVRAERVYWTQRHRQMQAFRERTLRGALSLAPAYGAAPALRAQIAGRF